MAEARTRPAWAEVDLGAVRHNTALLRRRAAPATVCAVVKADGYGHGAPAVARAAIEGGAARLAVATVEEGVELRETGIAQPVLLLSEPPPDAAEAVVAGRLTPTVCSMEAVARLGAAARRLGARLAVHVKVDTGMHRLGAQLDGIPSLVAAVSAEPALHLEGLWTHLSVADGTSAEDRAYTAAQLARFEAAVAALPSRPRLLHAANSAAALQFPASHYDLVRCGIALYGVPPAPDLGGPPAGPPGADGPLGADGPAGTGRDGATEGAAGSDGAGADRLRPALSLRARVVAVRELDAGERPSYGRLRPLPERSVVATVPIGYADGVPRRLFGAGFTVLVRGERRPLAGMVTMDQIVVDCGPGSPVAPGDEVTLLGRQGDEEVTATEWADLLGTIGYEILCGIGPRVPRIYTGEVPAGWRSSPARGVAP